MTKDPKLKSPDPAFGTELAEQPSGEPEHEYDRLGEQQQAQEEEPQEEIDWDAIDWEEIEKEIEKHPSDYPELCPEARERDPKRSNPPTDAEIFVRRKLGTVQNRIGGAAAEEKREV